MKVAIAGGHGQIALRLTRVLSARGDQVLSLIRKSEHVADVEAAGGTPVLCDLEASDVQELAWAIENADAIVFAAGAGPGSGAERKETVDFGAAVKLIEAAKANGIARYVMISATGANAEAAGDDTFRVYLRAKGRADEALVASGLDHTVVRPTGLTDEPGDGKVHVASRVTRGSVPRDDVAAVVAAVLLEPRTVGKTFEVAEGDTPVEEALRNL